jgi:hypothetical protein
MDNVISFVKQHGHIIGAIIAGTCALTAAYIRRDRRWEKTEGGVPVVGLLFGPLLSILLGAACLAAENYAYPIEPTGDALAADPGTILAWVGCVLISAGLLWFPYNIYRLITWPRPAEPESEPVMDVLPASTPTAAAKMVKPAGVQKKRNA